MRTAARILLVVSFFSYAVPAQTGSTVGDVHLPIQGGVASGSKSESPTCTDSLALELLSQPNYIGKFPNADQAQTRELIRQKLFRSLETTKEQRILLSKLEQGTPEWLAARVNRLTASNFGAAVGHNKWKSPERLVHDMLYGGFEGNDATRWGNEHEQVACEEYALSRRAALGSNAQLEITHSGLNVDDQLGWLAVSPDGHVVEEGSRGVLEIKCPFSKRIYDSIPAYYYDQVQGLLAVLGCEWADFCVWTPERICIQRVAFQKRYWSEHLLPGLTRFYHELFVPAYIDKEMRAYAGDTSQPTPPR